MALPNKIRANARIACLIMAAFCSQCAVAESSVWKAEKEGRYIYLGGTIHVLSQDDYPLPKEYDASYQQADQVYFETDIQGLKSAETSQKLLRVLLNEEGESLETLLKPETLKALEAYLQKRNLPLAMFTQYSPSGLYLVLMSLELSTRGMMSSGVDEHFDGRAREDNKTIGQLETIEQQLSFLGKIGEGDADQLIMYGLRDLEKMPEIMAEMKATWRSGDRESYRRLLLEPFVKDYPAAYQSLLVKRNQNWLPKIEALFATPEVELVLVGALHMVGKDGLLQQLEAKGYRVEPVMGEAMVQPTKAKDMTH